MYSEFVFLWGFGSPERLNPETRALNALPSPWIPGFRVYGFGFWVQGLGTQALNIFSTFDLLLRGKFPWEFVRNVTFRPSSYAARAFKNPTFLGKPPAYATEQVGHAPYNLGPS